MAHDDGRALLRWGAWFGDRDIELDLPPGWDVTTWPPVDGPDIGPDGIAAAFAAPIGTGRIRELAAGRRNACIVVDDLSRPTPAARLLPPILAELAEAGIADEDVLILAGVGNHRQMMRQDFVAKVGEEVVRRYRTRSHFSWADCREVGTTSHGTRVSLNSAFVAADVKILVGAIVPHTVAGYAGGAKLVLPGVASIRSATDFHGPSRPATGLAVIPPARRDAEEAARMVGVDCIVNAIPNSRREIAGLVVGDVVAAHRAGVELAKGVFATPTPAGVDVCILSAYPKDNELLQYSLAFNVWATAPKPIAHEGGTVVVASAASEGWGFHSLAGEGMPLWPMADPALAVAPRSLLFFAPGATRGDLPPSPGGAELITGWPDVVRRLEARHGPSATVAVFPCASMQLAEAVCGAGEAPG
jgi:hypothetical protein